MYAKGEARIASKAFSTVYNGNARRRGEQVLPMECHRRVDQSDPSDKQRLYEYGTYSTDIHTKDTELSSNKK